MYWVLLVLITFTAANATVMSGSDLCPEEFQGKVKALIDELGPETPFSKQKVVLTNVNTIRGELSDEVTIDVLKNGPFSMEVGKDYRLQLRKGKLCWVEQI